MPNILRITIILPLLAFLSACTYPSGGDPTVRGSKPMPPKAVDQPAEASQPDKRISLLVNGKLVPMARLKSGKLKKGSTVTVKSAKDVPYSEVIAVFNEIYDLGYKIEVQTQE